MTSLPGFSLAHRLAAGETVFTGWCGLPSSIVAETIAREGFPAVTIDCQHGLWDLAGTVAAIPAIRAGGAAPIVRIPVGDLAYVSRALDLGAEGIVAPMINTEADARALVEHAKFPPIGERSWGPHRATVYAGVSDPTAYLHAANAETVTFAMIETRTALTNIDAIMAMPGIDAAFLGPSDLSITLTDGKVLDPHSKEVDAGVDRIAEACRKAKKIAGAFCATPERALDLQKRGYRFIAIANDLAFLRAGTSAALKALKA